jgi:hypothetical protein
MGVGGGGVLSQPAVIYVAGNKLFCIGKIQASTKENK